MSNNLAEASRPFACREGSIRRRCVGTWLRGATLGLAFLSTGSVASSPSIRHSAPILGDKYGAFRTFTDGLRVNWEILKAKVTGEDSQLYWEMNCIPPRPLQVFEYGPSRKAWLRNPEKYKYQYVCVVATMGPVEEGVWHVRRAPIRWTRQPPFHLRIVRPNPAGMLDVMLSKGKIKLAKKNVTIKKTDKRTGRVIEQTRPMTVVERTDVDPPKHIKEMLEAQKEGRDWKDTRPTKGRWGPNSKEVKEQAFVELLAEAGIETPEEIDDINKVIDTETGEKFDLTRYFDYGDTIRGYRRLRQIDNKIDRREAREEKRRSKKQGGGGGKVENSSK